MSHLQWAGYLSTTAVYGGNEGKWIDEETDCVPDTQMGRVRLLVEDDWRRNGMFLPGPPTRVFRLGQMYGPGRGPLQAAKDRNALRVAREGHVASFVHVDDVAQVVVASMAAAESAPTALATAPTVSQPPPPRPHSSPDFSRIFRPFPTPPFCVCVFLQIQSHLISHDYLYQS